MASLNMTNMNTLLKKGYLLAGVIMAANMFVVNEVKAMNMKNSRENNFLNNSLYSQPQNEEGKNPDETKTQYVQNFLSFLLSHENIFNLIGGAVFSGFNNYFKWWDYNPGGGCPGWRFKRLLNGMFQFEVNFNLGRGAFWLISYIIFRRSLIKSLIKIEEIEEGSGVKSYIKVILQGFVSMPFTLHIPKINLSISISLDSILWIGIDKILYKGKAPIIIKKSEEVIELYDKKSLTNIDDFKNEKNNYNEDINSPINSKNN